MIFNYVVLPQLQVAYTLLVEGYGLREARDLSARPRSGLLLAAMWIYTYVQEYVYMRISIYRI